MSNYLVEGVRLISAAIVAYITIKVDHRLERIKIATQCDKDIMNASKKLTELRRQEVNEDEKYVLEQHIKRRNKVRETYPIFSHIFDFYYKETM